LFALQKIVPASIDKIAKKIGLDQDKFKKDMKSSRINRIVDKDLTDARKLGVTGTPTIFINGRKLKKRTLQGFQLQIDSELRKLN